MTPHVCRPIWLGPDTPPRCVDRAHFWAELRFTHDGPIKRDVTDGAR